jgi:hypothetical protein
MEDDILSLLDPTGALRQRATGQAQGNALTALGLGLLRASRGQPGQGRPSTAQAFGEAGPGALQAYQQTFDKTLADTLKGMQVQEMQKRRQQQEAGRTALQQAYERMSGLTPQGALAMPGGQAGPTVQRAEMIGQRQPMSQQELLGLAMNPNIDPEAAKRALDAAQLIAPKASPGKLGEFEAALSKGVIPKDTTYQQFLEMGRQAGTTVNVGGEQDPFMVEAKKKQAQQFSEIATSGLQAQRASRDITRLGSILDRIDTGGVAVFKQAAGNIGIKTEGLDDIQSAQAIVNKLVPQQRPPGSGTMSDADLALYKESLPRLINQPGANKEIVKSMKDINNYLVKEGQIASQVLDGTLTPSQGRQKLIELGNPIQEFFERNPSTLQTTQQIRVSPQDQSLIDRYQRR